MRLTSANVEFAKWGVQKIFNFAIYVGTTVVLRGSMFACCALTELHLVLGGTVDILEITAHSRGGPCLFFGHFSHPWILHSWWASVVVAHARTVRCFRGIQLCLSPSEMRNPMPHPCAPAFEAKMKKSIPNDPRCLLPWRRGGLPPQWIGGVYNHKYNG